MGIICELCLVYDRLAGGKVFSVLPARAPSRESLYCHDTTTAPESLVLVTVGAPHTGQSRGALSYFVLQNR